MKVKYELIHQDKQTGARYGKLIFTDKDGSTQEYETPMFMPVGTQASVKTLSPEQVKATNPGIILSNTYHLWLRPTPEVVKKAGGLHQFMNWHGPILTDSGGYQVFSLAHNKKKDITEEGVHFKSEIDGRKLFLTPEESIRIQNMLDSDIAMSFDECPPATADYNYLKNSVERTIRWAKRGKAVFNNEHQNLFASFRVVHTKICVAGRQRKPSKSALTAMPSAVLQTTMNVRMTCIRQSNTQIRICRKTKLDI